MTRDSEGSITEVARRLLGFTGWPLLSLVAPLVATPIVARYAGDGWSGIVTAMSIGTFGNSVTAWGWSYIGPARVALTAEHERSRIYAESIRSRLLMSLMVLPIVAALTAILASDSVRIAAVLVACAFTLGGLSPQWYCIGVGKPRLLGIYDTLPRVIGTALSIPLMLATRSIIPYPLLLIAAVGVSLWLFPKHLFGHQTDDTKVPRVPWSHAWRSIRSMTSIAATNLIGVGYAYAPVPLATALLTNLDSSHFASGDQLYRYALFAVTALGNALQGWTLEVRGASGRRRQLIALLLHVVLGIIGALTLVALGPWATGVLFGQQLAAPWAVTAWYGLAFAFISMSTPLLRNLLIPAGKKRQVLVATGLSAVGGLALMTAAGVWHSAPGIAAGMALSEALLIILTIHSAVHVLNQYSLGRDPLDPTQGR